MVHERQTVTSVHVDGMRKKISQEDTLISLQKYGEWHARARISVTSINTINPQRLEFTTRRVMNGESNIIPKSKKAIQFFFARQMYVCNAI